MPHHHPVRLQKKFVPNVRFLLVMTSSSAFVFIVSVAPKFGCFVQEGISTDFSWPGRALEKKRGAWTRLSQPTLSECGRVYKDDVVGLGLSHGLLTKAKMYIQYGSFLRRPASKVVLLGPRIHAHHWLSW